MTARTQRVEENLGLVHSCAGRFVGRGVEYDDLFQAGCMGLCKAADGFDESRGFCFSTYAVPLILGEIKRLFRDGGAVKVSRGLKELSQKAARETERFLRETGREPTVSELAVRLGVEPSAAAEALCVSVPPLSLTREADGDDGGEWDLPSAGEEERVTDRLALKQVLSELPRDDRRLIVLRYVGEWTQQKTADELGMTQVQVSRRERAILAQLRRRLTG